MPKCAARRRIADRCRLSPQTTGAAASAGCPRCLHDRTTCLTWNLRFPARHSSRSSTPETLPARRLTAPVRGRCGGENVRSKHRATLSSRLRSNRSYRSRNSRPLAVSRVPEARLPPGCRSSKRNPAAFSSSRRYPQAFRYDISNRSTACLIEPSSSIRRRSAARPWPNFTVSPKNTQTLSFGFIVFIIAHQSQAAAVLPLCRIDYTSSVSYRKPGISTLPDFAQGSYVCRHHSVIGAWYSRTEAGKSTPRKLPCGNCVEVRMIWS